MMGDPTKLHQVVMNLCTNAAHSMRESGRSPEIVLEDTILDERFAPSAPGVGARPAYPAEGVRQTGHGIPPEVRDRISDPFFTDQAERRGDGLGLSVVQAS
jgi:signal transduction histidine kinase